MPNTPMNTQQANHFNNNIANGAYLSFLEELFITPMPVEDETEDPDYNPEDEENQCEKEEYRRDRGVQVSSNFISLHISSISTHNLSFQQRLIKNQPKIFMKNNLL